MNTKKCMYFLFKIVLFIVNYHECYFVFIEFEYDMKLFVWMMKTMVSPPPPPPPLILGGTWNKYNTYTNNFPRAGASQFSSAYIL